MPPYRIENKTSDVVVYFAQSTLTASREKWNWLVPRPGGSAMAYAWDEPTAFHRLQVQVQNCVSHLFLVACDPPWSALLCVDAGLNFLSLDFANL